MKDELDLIAQEAEASQPDAIGPAPVEDAPAPAPDIATAEYLASVYAPLFAILAPEWKVSPDEIKALADAHGAVADKYFPGGLNLGVEVTAILTTAMVIGPRLGTPRKKTDVKPATDNKQTQARPDLDPEYTFG